MNFAGYGAVTLSVLRVAYLLIFRERLLADQLNNFLEIVLYGEMKIESENMPVWIVIK